MSFQSKRRKHHDSQDSMWTSYSDLFLGLSVIFLLLYVTASLRQGTDGLKQVIQNQQITKENQDLRQQLKVYESLKQNYLETQAAGDDQKTYDMLMSKLDLLKDEANDEKNKLIKAAQENDKKEQALNQYQQIIRNIVNANLLAKARIKNRDVLITKNETVIEGQNQEITGLESELKNKQKEIEKGESKIANLEGSLQTHLKKLENAYKMRQISEKKYKEQQNQLKAETEQKVASLKAQNDKVAQELININSRLEKTSNELRKVGAEKQNLEGQLASTNEKYKAEVEKLKGDFDAQRARDRKAFEKMIANERLSGEEKAKREAAFRQETERKAQGLAKQIAEAEGRYRAAQGELTQARGDLNRTKADLAKAQENLNARKKLAESIKGRFRANGVVADVDPNTGDVLLSFGGEYFNTGDAKLKSGMKKVLEKAMPMYAQSLFEDGKIAHKIENVEIVGFASPTYKGKYIDPTKLNAEDRQAVNYNLDLSYKRARSIFDHVYTKMEFDHKQRLLPLVKVTGRSFFQKDRDPASAADMADICRRVDCEKKQTVIIKFKLKD